MWISMEKWNLGKNIQKNASCTYLINTGLQQRLNGMRVQKRLWLVQRSKLSRKRLQLRWALHWPRWALHWPRCALRWPRWGEGRGCGGGQRIMTKMWRWRRERKALLSKSLARVSGAWRQAGKNKVRKESGLRRIRLVNKDLAFILQLMGSN